jgi:hypothetical protein
MEVVEALAWEEICDDALLLILSYLDVTSAVRLTKGTSLKWRQRSESLQQPFPQLWRIWYDRLGYSPAKLATSSSILSALVESRQLSHNMIGRKSPGSCFPLPNRRFSFLPITPNDDDDEMMIYANDPPPVPFACDSFLLTGAGTEFVLLNPFTSTVKVHKSVVDLVIHSDEGIIEKAWRAASNRIVQQRRLDPTSSSDEDEDNEHLLAADAISDTLHRNHSVTEAHYRVDPQQTLVKLTDTTNSRLEDYFPDGQGVDSDLVLSCEGIEAKPVMMDGVFQGTLLALFRTATRNGGNDSCWEVLTWYKDRSEDEYGHSRSCRLRGPFHILDVCPHQQVVYMNPLRERNLENNDNGAVRFWEGHRKVCVLPLMDESRMSSVSWEWLCGNNVTFLTVSPCTGKTVLVGTCARTLELYHIGRHTAKLTQLIKIDAAATEASKRHGREPAASLHPSAVKEICCAKDLPLARAGFWTLQHASLHGSTLLLWKIQEEDKWGVEAMIQLPLSGRRTPKILYDGRRLLVYGQDHIGMILLVYQVRYSNEDDMCKLPMGVETSGGVLNLGQKPTVRFANRIRHIALSGMENILYESLYMTANDRLVSQSQ